MPLRTFARAALRHISATVKTLLAPPAGPAAPESQPPPLLSASALRALHAELELIRRQVKAQAGPEDVEHLERMVRWGRACTGLGLATAWIGPNPVSALLLSTGTFSRWAMVAHHIIHRGYDAVPGVPARYRSTRFARGARRFRDWFDWMVPEAWHEEHDLLHHYRLGEVADPDLVEHNLGWLRDAALPRAVKTALVAVMALSWKWAYYAPNPLEKLQDARARRAGRPAPTRAGRLSIFNPLSPEGRELWWRCYLPYAAWNFAILPSLYAPLGPWAVFSVWSNLLMAEALTNLHAFIVIVPNHAGADLSRFPAPTSSRQEFYLRQILSSANYPCGDDWTDFLHGGLNYQIEHHLFPDLSMLQYRRCQPLVKALCARHGVPYVQESVWRRLRRTVAIMNGQATMRRHPGAAVPEASAAAG